MNTTILTIIQMLLAAEPAVVGAIHNLLAGTGTADDLAILKVDAQAWQAIADKAGAEVAKLDTPVVVDPVPPVAPVPPVSAS